MTKAVLGIIGGSGVYDLPGLENVREEHIKSPWGEPSGAAAHRRDLRPAGGLPAAPRQGPPALALRHQLSRQHRRAQARRRDRPRVALGLRLVQGGIAARHLRADRPVRRPHAQARVLVLRQGLRRACLDGASGVARACASTSPTPRWPRASRSSATAPTCAWKARSSPRYAESMTYKQLGYSVIGMTNMPEAKLAREAEICYATVAMVTDFDCWHPDHDAVTVQDIIKVLGAQCREGEEAGRAARAGFPARARAVPDRLRPRARHRADHRAGGARSGAVEEARRGGGAGAGEDRPNDSGRRLRVASARALLRPAWSAADDPRLACASQRISDLRRRCSTAPSCTIDHIHQAGLASFILKKSSTCELSSCS